MADFVKTEWVNGAAPGISAQELNRMEEGIYGARNPLHAMVSVNQGAYQAITSSPQKIRFPVVIQDPYHLWDAANNRFILPKGLYLINVQIYCSTPTKIFSINAKMDPAYWLLGSETLRAYSPIDPMIKLGGLVNVYPHTGDTAALWLELSTAEIGMKIADESTPMTFFQVLRVGDFFAY